MQEKVVLIGAGSAMFTRGLVADLLRRKWEIELALVDIDSNALSVAEGLTRKMIEAKRSDIRLTASTDRRAVLKGATAIICTIGVGGRRAWEQDVTIPRKYGVFQPVGDSVMPGGTSRALRMIPAMVDIAKDVMDLAPRALFFNYGNPMTAVCRGVRKATGANMVGLCHGVNHVGAYLAKAVGAPLSDVTYSAVGLNHMTWFTELRIRGDDAMPRLHEIARQRLRRIDAQSVGTKFAEAGTAPRGEAAAADDNPFSWQLFELFGAFPCCLDRHVTEFFPNLFPNGKYFGKTLGKDAYSIEDTIAWGDRIFEQMRADALSKDKLGDDYFKQLSGEHEQVTDIIESIRRCDGRVYSANLPNRGQVPNLPQDAVLETPAIADGGRLKPIQQPPLAPALVGTLATRLGWVEATVEAALEGNRQKLVQALVLDGSVTSLDTAAKLADDLLAAQAPYLPQFANK